MRLSPFDPSLDSSPVHDEAPEESLLRRARVLVIDDHPIFREGLIQLLRIAVSGSPVGTISTASVLELGSVESLLNLTSEPTNLQLVLLDLTLPGLSGAEAVAALHQRLPHVPIVVVSAIEERRYIMAVLHAGARAFISKSLSPSALSIALRRAMEGRIGDGEILQSQVPAPPPASVAKVLTNRQREVLALLALGHTNKEIAQRVEVAEITIKQHVSRIFTLVGATNRTQAVLAARRAALVPTEFC